MLAGAFKVSESVAVGVPRPGQLGSAELSELSTTHAV